MADVHAYSTSRGGLVQTVSQLRHSFPATVDASTLKKFGFAPNNESYVISVLRFLGLIDEEGNRTAAGKSVFSQHADKEFCPAFEALVKKAYAALFDLRGDGVWELDTDALTAFFRANDGTGAIVGKRQAGTFQVLAGFAGHGEMPSAKTGNSKVSQTAVPKKERLIKTELPTKNNAAKQHFAESPPVGLTVRVEINLPPDGDQATYDKIFKSIKENLLNA